MTDSYAQSTKRTFSQLVHEDFPVYLVDSLPVRCRFYFALLPALLPSTRQPVRRACLV